MVRWSRAGLTLHSFPEGWLNVFEAWDDLLVDLRTTPEVTSCSSDCKIHSPSSQSYLEGDLYFVVHSLLQHKRALLYVFQVPCNDGNTVWTRVWMMHTVFNILGALGVNGREPQARFTSQKVLCLKSGSANTRQGHKWHVTGGTVYTVTQVRFREGRLTQNVTRQEEKIK